MHGESLKGEIASFDRAHSRLSHDGAMDNVLAKDVKITSRHIEFWKESEWVIFFDIGGVVGAGEDVFSLAFLSKASKAANRKTTAVVERSGTK